MKSPICIGRAKQMRWSVSQWVRISIDGGVRHMNSWTFRGLKSEVGHRVDVDEIGRDIPRLLTCHWSRDRSVIPRIDRREHTLWQGNLTGAETTAYTTKQIKVLSTSLWV